MTASTAVAVSLSQIAKMIDHSLLHPTMTDKEILAGLQMAKRYRVAAACVKPYSVAVAKDVLDGSGVLICAVIGFPHGNSTSEIKLLEAEEAVKAEYVANEIRAINDTVVRRGAALKVIFETDFLQDEHIAHLCKICTALPVAFVKTSTGFGFVKQSNGMYACKGATVPHLQLMKANIGPNVQIKASGGIRTLDEVMVAMTLGVSRIGTSSTAAIMEEAASRGIENSPKGFALVSLVDPYGHTDGNAF